MGQENSLKKLEKYGQLGKLDDLSQPLSDEHPYGYPSIFFAKHIKFPRELPGVGIALRYRFYDIEPDGPWVDGFEDVSGYYAPTGSDLYLAEVALYVITKIIDSDPSVLASWQYRHLNGTRYSPERKYNSNHIDVIESPTRIDYRHNRSSGTTRIEIGPDTIYPSDHNRSKEILERQLLEVCKFRPINPLDLEKDAKRRIIDDEYLPDRIKKRFRPEAVSSRPPWYKRLL